MSEAGYRQRRFALPGDATEIVFVRHGASAPVFAGQRHELTPDGWGDPPLAPEGEAQAEAAARRLAGEPLSALFVTSLRRTVQTAAPLAARTGLEPAVVPELTEVHLGEWEGGEYRIRIDEGDPVALRCLIEERWDLIPGAEPMDDFAARVRAGVQRVAAGIGAGRVGAAFVHGGVIGEICHQATSSRRFAFVHADNCSLHRLVVLADGHWLLRAFNETAHLP